METVIIGGITLGKILSAILLLIVCVVLKRIASKMLAKIIERSHMEKTIKSFLNSAVEVALWVIIVLVVADELGISVTSLVAIVSVASLALSLSVQDILTNIFSGMTIIGTKPFDVGDFVEIGDISGNVTALKLFYTEVTTVDNKVVSLPNSTVASANITNYSAKDIRRIDLTITASYDDAPEDVKKALLAAAEETEGVLQDPAPVSGVSGYGSSSIEYQLLAWAKVSDFIATKFDLTEKIYSVFKEQNVTMTYDHVNVHLIDK